MGQVLILCFQLVGREYYLRAKIRFRFLSTQNYYMKRNIIIALAGLGIVALAIFYFSTRKKDVDKKAAAAAFSTKKWYYSSDGGKSWVDRAEPGLKGFMENGDPIHLKPEWVWAEWLDENTILWTASDKTTSLWKAFDVPLSSEEITKSKAYAVAFPTKTWYYSVDGGQQWLGEAVGDLKGFDQNGQPIHVSEAWLPGKWEDENTILWKAMNGSESVWKAFDGPPK